jgi:hypothetical protein
MEICGWSESTFHYKVEHLNFEKLELEAIENLIKEFKTGQRKWNLETSNSQRNQTAK